MPIREPPCKTQMYDIELTFVDWGQGIIEICLNQRDGPISTVSLNKVNRLDRIPKLYKVMIENGYSLPSLEEFTGKFLKILKNYYEGRLPIIPSK